MASYDIGGFAWDAAKSERCLRERGFSFAFVVSAFADPDRRVEIEIVGTMARPATDSMAGSRGACSWSCTRCAARRSGSSRRARPTRGKDGDMVTRARLKDDGTVVEIQRDGSERPLAPEVDWARVDATTEAEIAAQIAEDDAEAMREPPPSSPRPS